MKKILLLLLTVLTFTSCIETYRSDDIFVVTKKEMRDTQYQYKYLYSVNHYMTSIIDGLYYKTYHHFVSNENYELGDTIKFIRYASNEN
jgi:hypothetical protein